MNGDYEATHPAMVKYLVAVKKEVEDLEDFHVSQVPRSENNQADVLSKLASSTSCDAPRSVFWEVMERRSIEPALVEVVDRSSTWMDGILTYLKDGTLLDGYAESMTI